MKITVYSPNEQAVGAFDGGTIVEQKPIGFPDEGSAVKRVGPLFYWAWAHAQGVGSIPSHPHKAFEIITYVVSGTAEHGDSLGTKSVVGPGGAQVMQTGSGVYHNERFIGPQMEGFQIWFEPPFREALKRPPTYNQYEHEQFPQTEADGVAVKTVIGERSPVQLVADVQMYDVSIAPGELFRYAIAANRTATWLAIRGDGAAAAEAGGGNIEDVPFRHKDFVLAAVGQNGTVTITAGQDEALRIILIDVPHKVDYSLYPNI